MSWLFSRVLVEAYSEATSSDGEQYAPSKWTDTPQAYCAPDKMKAFSRLSRFGITFAPLTDGLGNRLLTLYLAGFRVRISVLQESEKASKASEADFGRRWYASFATYDHATSSWKTAQRSLVEDLELYSETWPKSGTMRNGVCWERTTLERRTTENEFGYWPTPVASTSGVTQKCLEGVRAGKFYLNLMQAVLMPEMWPMPTAADGIPRISTLANKKSWALNCAVTNNDRYLVGRLNPTWVEWLMGWPLGWTDLSALETARYREWQRQHERYCTSEFGSETKRETMI